jgi:hypothetical protein
MRKKPQEWFADQVGVGAVPAQGPPDDEYQQKKERYHIWRESEAMPMRQGVTVMGSLKASSKASACD